MPLVYIVVATLPPELVDTYVAWLADGHVQAVVEGGATYAWVTRLDDHRVESRYHFSDQAAYDRYDQVTAPALRADGIERFGGRGVVFERAFGHCVLSI
jgi:hypothetical protein